MDKADLENLKKEFLERQLQGKIYDELNKLENLKIIDGEEIQDNAIKIAIRRAYEDSQVRTIKNHKSDGLYKWDDKNDNPMGYLLSSIKIFLESKKSGKEINYDTWHKDTCNQFLVKYNIFLNEKECASQCIGKSQKIVNMAIKYIYCMADENQEAWFEDAHMPLDHYTLENWFRRNIDKVNGIENIEQFSKDEIKDLKVWSNISDYDMYEKVQKAIRAYIAKSEYKFDDQPMTPLQAEFIIWEEEKIRETLLGVKKMQVNEKKKYYNAELEAIVNEAHKVISTICKNFES